MKKQVKFSKIAFKLDKETVDSIKEEMTKHNVDPEECEILRKSWATEEKADLEPGSRTAIKYVSTHTVDQVGDVVLPKGCDLRLFKKTGMPVFYNHDYSIPQIGRDEWIKTDNYGVKVKQVYADTGEGTLADVLWKLTSQDMNKQSSVGIIPLEVIRTGDEDFNKAVRMLSKEYDEIRKNRKKIRRIITKSIIFEHSDVSLACNTDTDVLAVSKMFRDAGADDKLIKQLGLEITEEIGDAEVEEVEEEVEAIEDKSVDSTVKDSELAPGGEETEQGEDVLVEEEEVVEVAEVVEAVEVVEVEEKKKEPLKATLVKEPQVVKLVKAPSVDYRSIAKEIVLQEIRRKMGRLV